MLPVTEKIIRAALEADQTVSSEASQFVFEVLSGESTRSQVPEKLPRAMLTRREVAAIIGRSLQSVDVYARRGVFRRVYLFPSDTRADGQPRKKRQAQGFDRESVYAAIRNGLL